MTYALLYGFSQKAQAQKRLEGALLQGFMHYYSYRDSGLHGLMRCLLFDG